MAPRSMIPIDNVRDNLQSIFMGISATGTYQRGCLEQGMENHFSRVLRRILLLICQTSIWDTNSFCIPDKTRHVPFARDQRA